MHKEDRSLKVGQSHQQLLDSGGQLVKDALFSDVPVARIPVTFVTML